MSFWKKKIGELGIPSEPDSAPQQSAQGIQAAAPSKIVQSSQSVMATPPERPLAPPPAQPQPSRSSDRPEDILAERFGKTRSALGEGTVIQGKLSFDTPVRIDGKLSGEIFSSKVLIIGPTGQIDAAIEVASLIVLGSVRGKINVQERAELWKGSQFDGTIKTPSLVVEEGSIFSGTCEMIASLEKVQSGTKAAHSSSAQSSGKSASDTKNPENKATDSANKGSPQSSRPGDPRGQTTVR